MMVGEADAVAGPATEEAPAITAVLCTRDRPHFARDAVASIVACEGISYAVIVVDQSDGTETAAALAPFMDRITYIATPTRGKAAALNIAIHESRSPLLAFTDDDCTVPPDWLVRGRDALAAYPEASICFGEVAVPEALRRQNKWPPALAVGRRELVGGRYGFRLFGMGANMIARREAFDRIGPFDEVLCVGGPLRSSEDFDLMLRAHRHGLVTLLEPDLSVLHWGVREHDEWKTVLARYGYGDAAMYMKYLRSLDPRLTWLAASLVLRAAALDAAREVYRRLRRRGSLLAYWRGWLEGCRASLAFSVDRKQLTYRPGDPPARP